jgi:ubiquinone/menaquinone biosynthesis C-methylase UbiE
VSRRVRHPIAARLFATGVGHIDSLGAASHRQRLLEGVAGRVLEIGAGTGISFTDYAPGAVPSLVAIEPEPYLRERAERAAVAAPVPVSVVDATAERLPFGDASFDVAVTSRVLCSVQDPAAALGELQRVLRPGGELRFYEHVASIDPGLARWQRALDLVWPWMAGGCHASRDTARAITDAGFAIEFCDRFTFRPCLLAAPTSPYILGRARRA